MEPKDGRIKEKLVLVSIYFVLLTLTGCTNNEKPQNRIDMAVDGELLTTALPLEEKEAFVEADISWEIPTKELGEMLAYLYRYEDMMFGIGEAEFEVLGKIPEEKAVPVHFYLEKEENRLLFLPDSKANAREGEKAVCFDEEAQKYYYYTFGYQGVSEEGIPVHGPESGIGASIKVNWTENVDGILYLGRTEVDFIREGLSLSPIAVEDNEYITALLEAVSKVLREEGYYGAYELHMESFGRVAGNYGSYGEHTLVQATAVLIGEGMQQYIYATLFEGKDGIECDFPFLAFAWERPERLFTGNGYYVISGHERSVEETIERVLALNRGTVAFKVEPEGEEEMAATQMYPENRQTETQTVNRTLDHRELELEEALRDIAYACSYAEWFGLHELGYSRGDVRDWDKKELAVYASEEKLLFIPVDQTESHPIVVGRETKEYALAAEGKDGAVHFQFYFLQKNPYAAESGQLKHTLVMNDWHHASREMFYRENFAEKLNTGEIRYLGMGILDIPAFPEIEMEAVKRDGYVAALEEYVKSRLEEEDVSGEYTLMIGEYATVSEEKVCISAAVLGKKEYYVRYLIYRSPGRNYYFWPVGFGLDGSLEECEADAHYMNRILIDRTEKLGRYVGMLKTESQPQGIMVANTDAGDTGWYPTEKSWLDSAGFADTEPYYEYTNPETGVQAVLYYDEALERGCVIISEDERTPLYAFVEAEEKLWEGGRDYRRFAALGEVGGDTGQDMVDRDFQEHHEYDEEGRPIHYSSTGIVEWFSGEPEEWTILKLSWEYDDRGKLRKYSYSHHPNIFGTWYQWLTSWPDEWERTEYERYYVTHGVHTSFYIYSDDSSNPKYHLLICPGCGSYKLALLITGCEKEQIKNEADI